MSTDFSWENQQPDPNPEVRVRRNWPSDNKGDCTKHPGNPTLDCSPCAEDETGAAMSEAVSAANQRCDDRFPVRYRNAFTEREDVRAWVKQMRDNPTEAPSLLLLGPTGTGKSYQAYAALRSAVTVARPFKDRDGYVVMCRTPDWKALTFADLCASLRPRGRDHDAETVLEGYRKATLILIDDLGAAKATEWVEEATYRLINGRYEDMRPAIFTTNLALPELKNAIGDRIASRLAETCTRIVLDGPDRRRTTNPKEQQ